MDFKVFCRELELDEEQKIAIKKFYSDDSNLEKLPFFFEAEFFDKYFPLLHYHTDLSAQAKKVREESTPADNVYANLLYQLYFQNLPEEPENLNAPKMKRNSGMAHLLLAMSSLPLIAKKHAQLGLPEHYAPESAKWLGGTIDTYRTGNNGEYGHDFSQSWWLTHSARGELFRIGRLEYRMHRAPDWIPAFYRHKENGSVVALCRENWALNSEGYRTIDGFDKTVKTTELHWKNHHIYGTPINREGRAEVDTIEALDLNVYEPLLNDHELVPSFHIPGGEKMSMELIRDSMKQALEFFECYFHRKIKLFVCTSWIFNPQLAAEIPNSNVAAFQRAVSLFPTGSNGRSGLFFIFGRSKEDFKADWPSDNSMQQAFHRVWEKHGTFRQGGAFVLASDLKNDGCLTDK